MTNCLCLGVSFFITFNLDIRKLPDAVVLKKDNWRYERTSGPAV